ncbi:MAG: diguanylate cyclase, partial [Polyangiaceae bacterium]
VLASMPHQRIVLVEPDDAKREVLAGRLRMQGYRVEAVSGPIAAAASALDTPPALLIADLWMPGVSGVQLCRLLRSEPGTRDVPVVLRGDGDAPRNRFWAERAGAVAYVPKGRMGDLVRSLARAIQWRPENDGFFFQIDAESVDIRERISELLDDALFESVLAAECRALANSETFARLFDLFTQFLTQVTTYRWMAILLDEQKLFALHTNPDMRPYDEAEARDALRIPDLPLGVVVEDDDASGEPSGPAPIAREICFGGTKLGTIVMAPLVDGTREETLMTLVASEIGGPIRMSLLIEDAQRLASFDPLTGTMNRRALNTQMQKAIAEGRDSSFAVSLLDVDHFKQINDTRGHAIGDRVLEALGQLLLSQSWACAVGRWGGEEFVIVQRGVSESVAADRAEALRQAIENMLVLDDAGERVPVTASIGVSVRNVSETFESAIERADTAMYSAKVGGRNRVVRAADMKPVQPDLRRLSSPRISVVPTAEVN